jgi:hypothetical protein
MEQPASPGRCSLLRLRVIELGAALEEAIADAGQAAGRAIRLPPLSTSAVAQSTICGIGSLDRQMSGKYIGKLAYQPSPPGAPASVMKITSSCDR